MTEDKVREMEEKIANLKAQLEKLEDELGKAKELRNGARKQSEMYTVPPAKSEY